MSLRALLILLPLSLAACGGGGTSAPPADAGQAPPAKVKEAAPPPTAKADAKDPCTLLSVAEVETALGGRLAGPPYRVMAATATKANRTTGATSVAMSSSAAATSSSATSPRVGRWCCAFSAACRA